MISAVISLNGGPGAPALADDLAAVGIQVAATADCTDLVQCSIQHAPDLVIVYDGKPGPALFEGTSLIAATAARPVVVFTPDPDVCNMALALRSGVHAYVVNGYAATRLRSVVHMAQARFQHDQAIRDELSGLNQRFTERTLVDRAKGILMGARQVREDEAYRALRSAAMHTKQRIGQVSQDVIDSARYGEAVNRAGQLRMLSQRVVKLYALTCCGMDPADTASLFTDSLGTIEANLAALARSLSQPTFGDLLDAVARPWSRLRAALKAPAATSRLPEIDALAEEVLLNAEQLTANLEVAAFATALRVINVSGRQRMLSQRVAKEALVATLAANPLPPFGDARAELMAGFAYLTALPMTNAEIAAELGQATLCWDALQAALPQAATRAGQRRIARLSEDLLTHFDRLTSQLERGMQAMVR